MVRTQGGSVLYVCTKFQEDGRIRSKVIRGRKISKFGHVTSATPTYGSFMVSTQGGSVLYLCTKFEADSLTPSKVMRGTEILKLDYLIPSTPI